MWKQADTAEQLCHEKDATIASLKEKLEDYETLKKGYEEAQEKLAGLNTELDSLRRSAEDQRRDAEMALTTAVMEKEREYMEKLREADAAMREAESAKAADITELTEAHREEVARIHAKLDERAEALMHERQQAADAKIELQQEKARVAELERQLKQLEDTLAKSKQ